MGGGQMEQENLRLAALSLSLTLTTLVAAARMGRFQSNGRRGADEARIDMVQRMNASWVKRTPNRANRPQIRLADVDTRILPEITRVTGRDSYYMLKKRTANPSGFFGFAFLAIMSSQVRVL